MRAVVIHRPGGHRRLILEERPDPAPGPGEIRVAVEAIGVNYADCVIRMGLYASAKKYVGWPITPGFEVAGQVAAVGEGVSRWSVGQPVMAVTRFGGYTSQLVVPAHQVFDRPAGWSVDQAAGFPTVWLTAWYALEVLAAPPDGGAVLVHSAAGGVGGALLQLARARGLRAVGVVGSAHKVETARAHGADEVIVRDRRQRFAERAREIAPEGYHAVFDAGGFTTLKRSYGLLAPTGRLVVYGFHSMLPRRGGVPNPLKLAWGWLKTPRFNPLDMTTTNRSVLAFNLSYLFDATDTLEHAMAQLLALAETGAITPPPVQTWPLDEVAQAQAALESGQTVGKLVLRP